MMRKVILTLMCGVAVWGVAACGTVATPVWEGAEATEAVTEIAEAVVPETEEPAVETEEPAVETEEPAVETEEPAVETEEPVVETEEPAVETEEPVVETEEPAVETEEPVVETEEPVVETEEPVVETEEPAVETEEPVAEAEEPAGDDYGTLIADAIAAGDPANGQVLFNQTYNTNVGPWICASCHSVTPDELRLVGPGLWGVRDHAVERMVESGDSDPVAYVRNSILNPQVYIVVGDPPYPDNLMPGNYGELFTEQELADVIAYVLSLGDE